jgi:hypothetical protein
MDAIPFFLHLSRTKRGVGKRGFVPFQGRLRVRMALEFLHFFSGWAMRRWLGFGFYAVRHKWQNSNVLQRRLLLVWMGRCGLARAFRRGILEEISATDSRFRPLSQKPY